MTNDELFLKLKILQEEHTQKITEEIKNNKTELEKKIQITSNKVASLETQNLSSERKRRKNNIILFGVEVHKSEILDQTIQIIKDLFGLNLNPWEINNAYIVGKEEEKRGLVIEFVSFFQKINIYRNIEKLKGKNITVINDLCPQDREEQKVLIKYLKIARSKKLEAKIVDFKLIIENRVYTTKELSNVQNFEDLDPRNYCGISNEESRRRSKNLNNSSNSRSTPNAQLVKERSIFSPPV